MKKPRSYQVEALTAIKAARARQVLRQLLQIFTGGGKTIIFASLRKFLGLTKRSLYLVHTEELAEQAEEKVQDWNPECSVGVEMATRYAADDDVLVVGSVPTLGRADSTRLLKFKPEDVDAIVVDEGHHITAESYQRILRHFYLCKDQDNRHGILLLAVTATPKRGDGVGLEQSLDELVYEFSMLRAIREGWSVNFKPYRIRTEENLDGVRDITSNSTELSLAINTPRRNEEIVKKWLEVGEGLRTIGFTVDIDHAKGLAKAFVDAGVKAAAIWGDDPERKWKLARHRGKESVEQFCIDNQLPVPSPYEMDELLLTVLLNFGVLIEGYDDPGVACVILGRPTNSAMLLEQQIGRSGRLPDGINNLIEARAAGIPISKEYSVIIDVTDNTLRHKLASVPSLFGLPPKIDSKGKFITDVLDQIDAVRDASPEVDLGGLEDLENIQSYIESVDLFHFEFSPEVLEHSDLQWHKTPDGNYLLLLPNRERITIIRNLLNTWNITGCIRGSRFTDHADDVPSALQSADLILKTLGRALLPHAKRVTGAKWAKEDATAAQIDAITNSAQRMGKALPDFTKMTKHEAAKILTAMFLRKAA